MAKDKQGFILYTDLHSTVTSLKDAEAGKLFKHILAYVNDLNPKSNDRIVNLVFEPIRMQLKRDLSKWENSIVKKSEGAKKANLKRWSPELYDKFLKNEISLDEAFEISKHQTQSDTNQILSVSDTKQSDSIRVISDNVNEHVSVSVNVIDNNTNVIYLERESKICFLVGSQKYQGKPSELVKQFHKMYFDSRIINSGITPSKFYEEFDKEFIGKHFTNERHVQNAIASTIKNLTNLKNGNNRQFSKETPGNGAATEAIRSGNVKDFGNVKL